MTFLCQIELVETSAAFKQPACHFLLLDEKKLTKEKSRKERFT